MNPRKPVYCSWCLLGAFLVTSPNVSAEATAGCKCPVGAHLHSGLFLRSSPGLVVFVANVEDADRARQRSRVAGVGLSSALSLGATPVDGLVVGGRIWTASISPRFVEGGKTVTPDDDSVKLTLLRIGPFVDFYPNPRGGFHTLLDLAWAIQLEHDTKGRPSKPAAVGIAAGVHTGHEWFVSNDMSFGFLGGVGLGFNVRSRGGAQEHSLFFAPELALTATYH